MKKSYSPKAMIEMLAFKNKPKQRDKVIEETKAAPLVAEYTTNRKARERHPVSQEFVIEKVIDRKPDVKSYVLRRKDGADPAFFRAGQYVVVRQKINGKLIARPISISSAPVDTLDKGFYEITVKAIPGGFMSNYIHDNWKVGDTVTTSGPQGVFYYEGFRDAPRVVAVAGGSGITPVVSMAKSIAAGDEDFELVVLYGTKNRDEILFADEFAEVMKQTDKVKVVHVLSDEEVDGYEHGFINADLIRKYAGDGVYSVFAAGPQAMYRFLDGETEKLGLIPKYYRKEIFGASRTPWEYPDYPQEAKGKTFTLTVKMCDKVYTMPCAANENIIVAMEREGIAGPNRCRGGICGWCRSRLLDGKVYIPAETDGRREADKVYGYIHPCASYAVSDITLEVPFNR